MICMITEMTIPKTKREVVRKNRQTKGSLAYPLLPAILGFPWYITWCLQLGSAPF